MKTVGVLALQGGFAKHLEYLKLLGARGKEIRQAEDLNSCQGLIIPGGESTTLTRLMSYDNMNMQKAIIEFARDCSIMGTCAGLILMAKNIEGLNPENQSKSINNPDSFSKVTNLGILDLTVKRNAYGRQIDSFTTEIDLNLPNHTPQTIPATFIRAPQILATGSQVSVLASLKEKPVFVQQGKHLGLSFHPELTKSMVIHDYFLSLL